MLYLEPIKQRLIALNLVNQNELMGCTQKEILQLEQQLGVKLPTAYQEFLRIMGKGAGQFLRGSDCFYDQLLDLQQAAGELLAENHFLGRMPDDAFVFLMHQGYQFSFFRLFQGEDPPTYSYCEGEQQQSFIETHERYSEFLAIEVELHQKSSMTVTTP
jgi:SMI1 / KNR4 family (SUKH-1)